MFVSYTSNLLEQMCDCQKCIMFLQKWILNLQDLPQNQSPETVPNLALLSSISHMTILFVFTCVVNILKLIDSDVCHRLWSILLWNVRACLLTIKYQVVQFLPNISISEHFESMYLTILQQILFLPL